jgi:sulfofructose kinase
MPMDRALEFSNAAAALNCTAIGARGHVPLRGEIDALLNGAKAGKVRRQEAPDIRARAAAKSNPAAAATTR